MYVLPLGIILTVNTTTIIIIKLPGDCRDECL